MNKKEQWTTYCKRQLEKVTPLLLQEGFTLEENQPHTYGERYILSGNKLVLYGRRVKDNLKVVIKITDDPDLSREIENERKSSEVLRSINFAYQIFHSPKEVLFTEIDDYTVFVTEYIPQEKTFLEYSLQEQFFFALKAFEAQESSHATTSNHIKTIREYFEIFDADTYLNTLTEYRGEISNYNPNSQTKELLTECIQKLTENKEVLERYTNFLTHWDFVPHNIRIKNDSDIYLLDHTAIRFGNKYEGWARFLNFMILYNPQLEQVLLEYVKANRPKDEYTSLQLMRLYRLCELVWFYTSKREKAEGKLQTLTDIRIQFWCDAIKAHLNNNFLDDSLIEAYKKSRNSLRDEDEKKRQEKLH